MLGRKLIEGSRNVSLHLVLDYKKQPPDLAITDVADCGGLVEAYVKAQIDLVPPN